MRLELCSGDVVMPLDLVDGEVTVGGGEADGIRFEGLEPALVTLHIGGGQLRATAAQPLRIAGVLFPALVRRVLVPGEELSLPNDVVLRRVKPPEPDARAQLGTALVARQLLSGELPPAQTRAAALTCVAGDDEGTSFVLAFAWCVVGREASAEVQLSDTFVSRKHATLFVEDGVFWVEPLSKTNALFVNGEAVKAPRPLREGDLLELGHTVLRFEAAMSGAPTPRPALPVEEASAVTRPTKPARVSWAELAALLVAGLLAVFGVAVALSLLR